jgi:hypothetical protein
MRALYDNDYSEAESMLMTVAAAFSQNNPNKIS